MINIGKLYMQKHLSVILILSIIVYSVGCKITSTEKTLTNELEPSENIESIVLLDGSEITFDDEGGYYDASTSEVRGFDHKGKGVKIHKKDILYANVSRINPTRVAIGTLGVIVLIGAVIGLIALASKQSCPFIYSWDGEQYVFDAEPLGGAICKALQRTDRSRLDHIRPDDGKYKIKVTNEVNEIQYIDKLNLEIVDHSRGMEIVTNERGEYYAVDNVKPPVSAKDKSGKDLINFFSSADGIKWQTKLPQDENQGYDSLWHNIYVKFEKPVGAKSVKLVFKGGTSLWGSQMVRDVTELYGSSVGKWYESLYGKQAYDARLDYMKHDNIYFLDVLVKENGEYVKRAVLPNGGPFVHEKQFLDIDLSNHTGDTLEILLKPPKSFWAIDFIGLTTSYQTVLAKKLEPLSAVDDEDENIDQLPKISSSDSTYLVLPEIGDGVDIEFEAPLPEQGMDRTVFAVTDGFYMMNLDTSKAPQLETMFRIALQPGEIIRFALKRFKEKYPEEISRK